MKLYSFFSLIAFVLRLNNGQQRNLDFDRNRNLNPRSGGVRNGLMILYIRKFFSLLSLLVNLIVLHTASEYQKVLFKALTFVNITRFYCQNS